MVRAFDVVFRVADDPLEHVTQSGKVQYTVSTVTEDGYVTSLTSVCVHTRVPPVVHQKGKPNLR